MTDPIDISSEEERIYVYHDGREYRVYRPVRLFVTASGSHRVVDQAGWTHRPANDWIGLKWKPFPGEPAYVA